MRYSFAWTRAAAFVAAATTATLHYPAIAPTHAATVNSIEQAKCGDSVFLPLLGEVIIVCEQCPSGEVKIGETSRGASICVSGSLWSFLQGGGRRGNPNPLPPGEGGDGAEPGRPTEQQCAAELQSCFERANDVQSRCKVQYATFAALTASRGNSCHGNEDEILEGSFFDITCTREDLFVDPIPLSAENYRAVVCQEDFRKTVVRQCMRGIEDGLTLSVNGGIALGPFNVGVQVSENVTAKGPGYNAACASLANNAADQCSKVNELCLMSAMGTANRVFEATAVESVEGIRSQIDLDRLGLDTSPILGGIRNNAAAVPIEVTFRRPDQGALETEELYRARLTFLARWSAFLNAEGIAEDAQQTSQSAFSNAQYGVQNIQDDFENLLLESVFIDPVTSQNILEAQIAFDRFIDAEYWTRLNTVESTLMETLAATLGPEAQQHFEETIWPGMQIFEGIRPMVPRQVIAPSP